MGINRIKLQDGSPAEMIKAQEAAASDPALDAIRQQLFGQDYIQDIGKGQGIAQYYSGFGLPNSLQFTPASVEETAPVVDTTQSVIDDTTPVVDVGGGGGGGQNVVTGGDGIMSTAPAMDQAAAIEAMTQPEAYDIPGTMPLTPVSGAFGPFDYLQPTTPITQDRQDAFDQKFAFEDPKALAARGIEPDSILPEARPDDLLPEGFDPYFSLEAPGITPFERATQLEETPIMYSEFDDFEADPGAQPIEDFAPEQQGLISQAFSKVGSTAGDIMNDLSQIPGAVADFTNQTVDVFGKKINVGGTLLKAGINKIVGGPITLVFDALGAIQTTPEQKEMQSAAQSAGIIDPNNPTKDIYGTNIVSAFGDYDQSVADSIATLEESGANPEKLDQLKNYQNEKAKIDTATITTRDAAIDAGIAAADEEPAPAPAPAPRSTPTNVGNPFRDGGGGGNQGSEPSGPPGRGGSPHFSKGGRVGYSEGGIVSLKYAKR